MSRKITTAAVVWIMILTLTACSEKEYGILSCPGGYTDAVDSLLVYPRLEFQQITVTAGDPDTPAESRGMSGMPSVYLGSDGDTESMILVNFDFSDVISEDFPAEMFASDQVRAVKFRLTRYRPYSTGFATIGSDTTLQHGPAIYFFVFQLTEAFDPGAYENWPGASPAMNTSPVNDDYLVADAGSETSLRIDKSTFLNWVTNGETVGLAIAAGSFSDPGLVGFASDEWRYASELPWLSASAIPGPSLVVDFGTSENLVIRSTHDTSTFHQIAEAPPEQLLVQTGLRSYPVLAYDMPALPAGVCATRFGFRIAPVAITSLWQKPCIALTQIDSTRIDWSSGTISASELHSASLALGEMCPSDTRANKFNYSGWETDKEGSYGLPDVLHMMLNYYDPNTNNSPYSWSYYHSYYPDTYFTQSTIHGPGAPLEYRPVLMIFTTKSQE